jgi:hypothetical protein
MTVANADYSAIAGTISDTKEGVQFSPVAGIGTANILGRTRFFTRYVLMILPLVSLNLVSF